MIYPLSIVNQSIVSTPFCHSDADCHFIDCQGVCSHHGRCQLNPLDTDLKRLCRNLLFMGSLYGGLLDFGLLTFAQPKEAYLRLRAHCFDPQNGHRNQTDAQHLLAIQRILGQIQASLWIIQLQAQNGLPNPSSSLSLGMQPDQWLSRTAATITGFVQQKSAKQRTQGTSSFTLIIVSSRLFFRLPSTNCSCKSSLLNC